MTHPDWCARGHRCNSRLDEHRSDPWTVRRRYGSLVITRVRQGGRERLEVRTVVALPPDPRGARVLSVRVLIAVDRALRRAVALVRP